MLVRNGSYAYKMISRGQKFHSSARNFELNLERTSISFQSTHPIGRVYRTSALNRGSYMSAHVLLNLINELRKRDKMRGLPSILSLFRNKFN